SLIRRLGERDKNWIEISGEKSGMKESIGKSITSIILILTHTLEAGIVQIGPHKIGPMLEQE
ncbi:MAG: hypothetical protein L0L79_06575, partial [Lentilactobacillus parabuchneri]